MKSEKMVPQKFIIISWFLEVEELKKADDCGTGLTPSQSLQCRRPHSRITNISITVGLSMNPWIIATFMGSEGWDGVWRSCVFQRPRELKLRVESSIAGTSKERGQTLIFPVLFYLRFFDFLLYLSSPLFFVLFVVLPLVSVHTQPLHNCLCMSLIGSG